MKREELEQLGLSKEQIDSVMGLHGSDIEAKKSEITTLTGERDALKTQLTEAGQQIESFKGMKKPEEVDAAIAEWKTKLEQAQANHAAELLAIEFDRDFGTALTGAKVKYTNEVKARLKLDELKDDKGKFIAERFNEQIGKLKTDATDLFEGDKPDPKIVLGGGNKPVASDAVISAARTAAGLKLA